MGKKKKKKKSKAGKKQSRAGKKRGKSDSCIPVPENTPNMGALAVTDGTASRHAAHCVRPGDISISVHACLGRWSEEDIWLRDVVSDEMVQIQSAQRKVGALKAAAEEAKRANREEAEVRACFARPAADGPGKSNEDAIELSSDEEDEEDDKKPPNAEAAAAAAEDGAAESAAGATPPSADAAAAPAEERNELMMKNLLSYQSPLPENSEK